MDKLQIHIYDDTVLRQKARPIEKITARHREIAAQMAEIMYESRGIGLAAQQVGLTERIVDIDVHWPEKNGKHPEKHPVTMINPEILWESAEDEEDEEGCLSLPGIDGDVWRPIHIRYRYTNLDGQTIEAEADDLLARCIQHELDHLNGILFIDRMAPDSRRKIAGKLSKLRKSQAV